MKKIQDFLEQLGLTEIEAKIYQEVLKIGPTTVKEVSELIDINRVTVHFQINNLIQKGLVTQIKQTTRRQIVAEPPEHLQYLIEQKEKTVMQLKSDFPDFIKTINDNLPKSKSKEQKVEVKYYEGKNSATLVYDQTRNSNEVYSFVNLDKYYKVFPSTEKYFLKALNKNNKRKVWDIAIDSPLARKIQVSHPRYFCKLIPSSRYFSGFDFIQFEDCLAIIQLELEQVSATVIKSKIIADSFKALHQSVWSLIK
ncbi:MAG: helix-turn-helix domain-containing protein [bacterium]|nr:helix-turn-helix domain-containing protein [bacterium]